MQCFDFAEVKRLREELDLRAKLVQLIGDNSWGESTTDYDYLHTPEGLAEVAKYAQGIGPWMSQLYDLKNNRPTALVSDAKAAGLAIHPYTHRVDSLPPSISSEQLLMLLFKQLQVDGVFTDFPDKVVDFLDQPKEQPSQPSAG